MAEPQPITLNFWYGGINSLLPPMEIAKNQYAWAENVINRGGIIQTRPGRRPVSSIVGKTPQGMCIFAPKGSTPRLVVAVDGSIYTLTYPNYEPMKLEGIQFSPNADKVYFCPTIKSVQRNADESLKLIDPTPVLMMQDGIGQAAFWDGNTARHLDPSANALETPIGTWMCWIGGRLWIANGNKILVGDIDDPLSHTEAQYLTTRDSFILSGDCTGMIVTANRAGILAFTQYTTTAFAANIADRKQWATSPGFQAEILQNVGCVAGRTAVNQYGLTHWLSDKGLVNLDIAYAANRSSKLSTEDESLIRSRRKLAPGLDGACAASYENLMFVSVPVGSRHNEHTWVMDQSAVGSTTSAAQAYTGGGAGVWASIWTGTRPVEWSTGIVGGRKRLFNLTYDKSAKDGTRIHVWEEMLSDRTDAGGRIACQWETGIVAGTELLRFKFARLEGVEILGRVDLKVFVAGSRGPWYQIGSYTYEVEEGCFGSALQPIINSSSVIQEFRPQGRSIVTQEFTAEGKEATPEQKPFIPGIDKGFRILLEWTGRFGVREISMIVAQGPSETQHGSGTACVDQNGGELGQLNAINEAGITVT